MWGASSSRFESDVWAAAVQRIDSVRRRSALGDTRLQRVVDAQLPDGQDIANPWRRVALDPADVYLINPRSTVVLLARRPGAAA